MKTKFHRRDDKLRGRHLVAARTISKNELIFCERPLCSLQSLDNLGVFVCRCCRSFCGTAALNLQLLSGKISRQEVSTSETSFVVPCRQGCGEVFCSKECENNFWPSHSLLCTGLIDENDEDHPLLQWKSHAVENNEIFLLVGDVISGILANPRLQEKVEDFTMVPWWDVVTLSSPTNPMESSEVAALEASCKRLCEESADLLRQAFSSKNVSDDVVVTPLFVSQIIGSFEQNSMGIRSRHPLCRHILENTDFRHENLDSIIECLERAGFIGNEDDNSDSCSETNNNAKRDDEEIVEEEETIENGDHDDGTGSQNVEWDYSAEEIDEFLSNLKIENIHDDHDDLDALFPPLDGTAMYSSACKMNHSCDPNVVIIYRDRQWGDPLVAHCIAIRDIEEGEELCISYIDLDQPYEKRQESLANYGFQCYCVRCQTESGNGQNVNDNYVRTTPNIDIDEGDLFGDDDDEEEEYGQSTEIIGDSQGNLSGTEALKEKLEEINNASDAFNAGAIPLPTFGEIHSFVVQHGKQALESLIANGGSIADELIECIASIKLKKFSACIVCGSNLEEKLYQILQKEKSWPYAAFRQVYWVATVTASAGLAQKGSYLRSQMFLDKANILGLDFQALPSFHSFVAHYGFEAFQKPSDTLSLHDDMQINLQKSISLFDTCLSKPIQYPIVEVRASIDTEEFQNGFVKSGKVAVIRGLAQDWKAISKWRNLSFFSQNYGHRLIPIELGSILSKDGMEEKVIDVSTFVSEHLIPSSAKGIWTLDDAVLNPSCYMAQHALLDQIPSLALDVEPFPRICGTKTKPLINIWMGTGGTRTPLHFDSYDNILVQIAGAKYVRIYASGETPKLYVTKNSTHTSQGNMSAVDCERENFDTHPLAKDAKYSEVVLMPGDAIFIPSGDWHYVRSLSTSISINYWWS